MKTLQIEVACLLPPWPEWIVTEQIASSTSLVVAARKIFSADINDRLHSQEVCRLINGLVNSDVNVSAWLFANQMYITNVLATLGSKAIRTLSYYEVHSGAPESTIPKRIVLNPSSIELSLVDHAMLLLACTIDELEHVGLPPTFLTPAGCEDRLGFSFCEKMPNIDTPYPTYEELLKDSDVILIPGGPHLGDCMIASARINRSVLSQMVMDACVTSGLDAILLGDISGTAYSKMTVR